MPRIASAFALTAIALVGCGSKPPPAQAPAAQRERATVATPTATPTVAALTHRELARALNRSCSVEKPKQDRLGREFQAAMDRNALPEAGGTYAAMMVMVDDHVDRIADLEPPAADRSAFRRYMSAERRIQGIGDRLVRALKKDDLEDVARLAAPFARERDRRLTAAIDLEADKCGS